jgi:hypothetical protein
MAQDVFRRVNAAAVTNQLRGEPVGQGELGHLGAGAIGE